MGTRGKDWRSWGIEGLQIGAANGGGVALDVRVENSVLMKSISLGANRFSMLPDSSLAPPIRRGRSSVLQGWQVSSRKRATPLFAGFPNPSPAMPLTEEAKTLVGCNKHEGLLD